MEQMISILLITNKRAKKSADFNKTMILKKQKMDKVHSSNFQKIEGLEINSWKSRFTPCNK